MLFRTCNHKWKILQETTTESKAERQGRVTDRISRPNNTWDHDAMYKCKHITILVCEHCDVIKRFVEEI